MHGEAMRANAILGLFRTKRLGAELSARQVHSKKLPAPAKRHGHIP
jgi:hypothetical protein